MEEQFMAVDIPVAHIPTVEGHSNLYMCLSTSVWWDIEKCEVPMACDPLQIRRNIKDALLSMGYHCHLDIFAYGDTTRIPNSVQQALNSTGITLKNVTDDAKTRREMMLGDMWEWAMANRAPANILLISSDPDYLSRTLHNLSTVGYNIILEYPPNEPKEERECLLRGMLDGKLPNRMVLPKNPKVVGRRFDFSSSSASSVNQNVAGKVGRPSIGSAPSLGNQKEAGDVGRSSISSAFSTGNQKVAGKVGRPNISSAPTGNQS